MIKKKLTFKINNGSKIQKWCQNFDFDTKKWILKIFPKFGNLGIKVVQTCVSTRNYEALCALFSSSC